MSHPKDGYSYSGCSCDDCREIRRAAYEPGIREIVKAVHRFRPCGFCGRAPDVHNPLIGSGYVGHEYR